MAPRKSKSAAWLVLAVSLLLAALSAPGTAAVLVTDSFRILFSGKDRTDARLVAGYAEEALDRVSREIGPEAAVEWKRVPIHVFSSRPEFLTGTRTDRKTFVVGRAWSAGAVQKIEIDASGTYSRIETVVAHEVTHVIVYRLLGPRVASLPLWANEGIARVESKEFGKADTDAVGEALSGGTFIPLEELRRKFPEDNERASLAYSEGASFMDYIRRKGGPGSLRKLLLGIARTDDFEKAVRDVTGKPLKSLEKDWRRSVSKSYLSDWLPRNLPFTIGLAMAVLCIAAYLAIRRRQRWNAAKWMIEESYEDKELDYGDPPE
ncbi:MAG: peptidase MA family metallohydrolase [Armatimonadota bacterium]|nr:peptidase MA family metallohydrolase [Armatimonadota bacterium]